LTAKPVTDRRTCAPASSASSEFDKIAPQARQRLSELRDRAARARELLERQQALDRTLEQRRGRALGAAAIG